METSLVVTVWGRLSHEGVQDVLREAGREMSEHSVSIVGVGAGFATCHAVTRGLTAGPGQVRGEIKILQLVSEWVSVGDVGR